MGPSFPTDDDLKATAAHRVNVYFIGALGRALGAYA
jgi:hypothetical protein